MKCNLIHPFYLGWSRCISLLFCELNFCNLLKVSLFMYFSGFNVITFSYHQCLINSMQWYYTHRAYHYSSCKLCQVNVVHKLHPLPSCFLSQFTCLFLLDSHLPLSFILQRMSCVLNHTSFLFIIYSGLYMIMVLISDCIL